MATVGALVVHSSQVHKEGLKRVPNAKEGRDSLELQIYGMEGVPEEFLVPGGAKRARGEVEPVDDEAGGAAAAGGGAPSAQWPGAPPPGAGPHNGPQHAPFGGAYPPPGAGPHNGPQHAPFGGAYPPPPYGMMMPPQPQQQHFGTGPPQYSMPPPLYPYGGAPPQPYGSGFPGGGGGPPPPGHHAYPGGPPPPPQQHQQFYAPPPGLYGQAAPMQQAGAVGGGIADGTKLPLPPVPPSMPPPLLNAGYAVPVPPIAPSMPNPDAGVRLPPLMPQAPLAPFAGLPLAPLTASATASAGDDVAAAAAASASRPRGGDTFAAPSGQPTPLQLSGGIPGQTLVYWRTDFSVEELRAGLDRYQQQEVQLRLGGPGEVEAR